MVVEKLKKLWLQAGVDFMIVRAHSASHCRQASPGRNQVNQVRKFRDTSVSLLHRRLMRKYMKRLYIRQMSPVTPDEFLLSNNETFPLPLGIFGTLNIALNADAMFTMCEPAVNIRREAFFTLTAGPSVPFRVIRAQSIGHASSSLGEEWKCCSKPS